MFPMYLLFSKNPLVHTIPAGYVNGKYWGIFLSAIGRGRYMTFQRPTGVIEMSELTVIVLHEPDDSGKCPSENWNWRTNLEQFK